MPARAFPAHPGAIPAARDYVVAMLHQQPADLQETAAVLVSELATNAVRHGFGQDFEVSVELGPDEDRRAPSASHHLRGNTPHRDPLEADAAVGGHDQHGAGINSYSSEYGVRRGLRVKDLRRYGAVSRPLQCLREVVHVCVLEGADVLGQPRRNHLEQSEGNLQRQRPTRGFLDAQL